MEHSSAEKMGYNGNTEYLFKNEAPFREKVFSFFPFLNNTSPNQKPLAPSGFWLALRFRKNGKTIFSRIEMGSRDCGSLRIP